ncbi:MAG TPA: response regulator [Chloroflexota bacterium]|nr:response regulator [Chloroflexota bacterium]
MSSGPSATTEVLEINARLRHALAEVAEREATIRQQAGRLAQLNDQLRQSHRALVEAQNRLVRQERLRALGEMASGIAHDLNNALAPVAGFAELLVDQPELRADAAQLQRYLQLILTGARDAAAVVARLKEFYRRGEDTQDFAPVDLNALVEQTVALCQPRWRDQTRAEGRPVELMTELGDAPPIPGRDTELREALTNLVFNALDAMPEGGAICIRTYAEPPTGSGGDRLSAREVILEVADTGSGMTEEVRRRCLEPFFTTKGDKGTGMGMAMVYGTVTRHGGRMEIESAPDAGTTVRLILPAVHEDRLPQDAEPLEAAGGATPARPAESALGILVVDDEPLVRAAVSQLLRADGHEVAVAANGADGLAILHSRPFDVVITDRAMPGMTGEQVGAAVKRHRPATAVVMLTGFGDLMRAAGQTPPHVDVVVAKPPTLTSLRRAIAQAREQASGWDRAGPENRVA